jgi:hypothetical protein
MSTKSINWSKQTLRGRDAIAILKAEAIYRWILERLSEVESSSCEELLLEVCALMEEMAAEYVHLPNVMSGYFKRNSLQAASVPPIRDIISGILDLIHSNYRLLQIVEDESGCFNMNCIEASLDEIDPVLKDRLQLFKRWSVGTDPDEFRLKCNLNKDTQQLESVCGAALSKHPNFIVLDLSEPEYLNFGLEGAALKRSEPSESE